MTFNLCDYKEQHIFTLRSMILFLSLLNRFFYRFIKKISSKNEQQNLDTFLKNIYRNRHNYGHCLIEKNSTQINYNDSSMDIFVGYACDPTYIHLIHVTSKGLRHFFFFFSFTQTAYFTTLKSCFTSLHHFNQFYLFIYYISNYIPLLVFSSKIYLLYIGASIIFYLHVHPLFEYVMIRSHPRIL